MKMTQKESVSERSSCDVEKDNLQSSSDSEDDEKLLEDCLSKNTSPSKSDTSADTNTTSKDTSYSSPDMEDTAVKFGLLSISDDGASIGHAIDKNAENTLNNLALSPSPSSSVGVVPDTTRPALENLNPSDREIQFVISGNAMEGVENLNAGTESANTSTAIEMKSFSGPKNKRPPDCSDSKWILVTSSAREKSELPSKALPKSEANPRQAVNEPFSSFETNSQAHQRKKTTMKSLNNRDRRRNLVAPRFRKRNSSDNAPLKNSFQHLSTTNSSIPPSAMARNTAFGTCARVICSKTLENSKSAKKDVVNYSNLAAENLDLPSSGALKAQSSDNIITKVPSASSSMSAEDQTNYNTLTEQNKSSFKLPVSSHTRKNCFNLKANNYFNLDAETPEAVVNRSCNLSDRVQNNCLPDYFDDYFSNGRNSDSSGDMQVNLPYLSSFRANSLFEQVDSRDCRIPLGTQYTDKNLTSNASYSSQSARSSDNSSDFRSVGRLNSLLIEPIRPGCLLVDEQNINMPPISAGASSKPSFQTISAKSNSVSTTFQNERLLTWLEGCKTKLYDFSGEKNKSSNFIGTNISFSPLNSSNPNKAYKPLNISNACKSSYSDNVSPLFHKSNDSLESHSSTVTISNTSIRNDTQDSIFKVNKSPRSSQKRNSCFKSQEENKSVNEKAKNIYPSKLALKNPFQRIENGDSLKFTSMLNESALTSGYSSGGYVCPTCAENRLKTVDNAHNPFSSQSFSLNFSEHPDLNNSFPQISHEQSVVNSVVPHTSVDCPAVNSNTSHISANRLVSKSAVPHASADYSVLNSVVSYTSADCSVLNSVIFQTSTDSLVSNSGIGHTSAHLTVVNSAIPQNSTDHSVSNSAIFDSSTNLPVLNHAINHTFHEHSVLNNTVVDTFPEPQVLNNVPYTFSDHPILNNTSSDTLPECSVLNIAISHTFPEHPFVSYTIFQDYLDPPVVNTTLSNPFLQVLNTTYSHLGLNESLPALFHTFPDHPVLHISLTYNYPEHPVILGLSHNFSDNTVSNITLSGSFSEHPVFYNAFNRILPSNTYLGEPVLTNEIRHNFHEQPVLNSALLQTAHPNSATFGDSFTEPSRSQTYSTQLIDLHQARIPQFPTPANTYQPFALSDNNFTNALSTSVREQYPSQPFSNIPTVSAPAFSNQSAYLQPRVFDPQEYPVHSSPTQNSYLQLPQQACFPQAGYHRSRNIQIETDSEADQEAYTDTDQWVYRHTD